jgi:hypothetical protein
MFQPSWPCLTRPSTSLLQGPQGVDDRVEPVMTENETSR